MWAEQNSKQQSDQSCNSPPPPLLTQPRSWHHSNLHLINDCVGRGLHQPTWLIGSTFVCGYWVPLNPSAGMRASFTHFRVHIGGTKRGARLALPCQRAPGHPTYRIVVAAAPVKRRFPPCIPAYFWQAHIDPTFETTIAAVCSPNTFQWANLPCCIFFKKQQENLHLIKHYNTILRIGFLKLTKKRLNCQNSTAAFKTNSRFPNSPFDIYRSIKTFSSHSSHH